MSADLLSPLPSPAEIFDRLADALVADGYAVMPGALPPTLATALLLRVTGFEDDQFRSAGVGRQGDYVLNPFVRSDEIHWLSDGDASEREYLRWMERLRGALNERLFLGLFDYEAHFARYQPGAFYKKHLDAFKGRSNRVLSTVFYLNPGWLEADGGQLLIYGDSDEVVDRVTPLMGTLVVFLSDRVPHEVLATRRNRHSIAGWFRVNNSLNQHLDPPR